MAATLTTKSRFALGCAYSLGFLGFIMMPLLVSVYITEYEFNESAAGLIVFSELGMLAVVSILLATKIDNLPKRHLCFAGIAIFIIGNFISLASEELGMMMLARGVTGIGAGLLLTSVSATISETALPEKIYALMNIIFGVLGCLLLALIPLVFEYWGERNIFWLFIITALILMSFISFMPNSLAVQDREIERNVINIFIVMLFAGLMLLTISDVGIWAYIDVRAQQLAIPIEQRSNIYILLAIACVIAPGIAYALGRHIGFILPLLAATLLMSLAGICLAVADSALPLAIGIITLASAYTFSLSFIFGICAIKDPSGRLAGAAPGFLGIAQAIAPASAGFTISLAGDFSSFAFVFALMPVLGGVLLCLSGKFIINS